MLLNQHFIVLMHKLKQLIKCWGAGFVQCVTVYCADFFTYKGLKLCIGNTIVDPIF